MVLYRLMMIYMQLFNRNVHQLPKPMGCVQCQNLLAWIALCFRTLQSMTHCHSLPRHCPCGELSANGSDCWSYYSPRVQG